MKSKSMITLLLCASLLLPLKTQAHEDIAIYVYDQPIVDDKIVVEDTYSEVTGWIVIYSDNNGELGQVLGYASINKWYTLYIVIELTKENRTPKMYAMMHEDNGTLGEFNPNEDPIINKNEAPNLDYYELFTINGELSADLMVSDQNMDENNIVIEKAISSGPGWIVVYSDRDGEPDQIIGKKAIFHGVNDLVSVRLNQEVSSQKVHISLLHDNGVAGEFEYPDIDVPAIKNNTMIIKTIELTEKKEKSLPGLIITQFLFAIAGVLILKIKKYSRT